MSDNQWMRLSGDGRAVNLADAREVEELDGGAVMVRWANQTVTYHGDEAARLRAWLREQYLPVIAPE